MNWTVFLIGSITAFIGTLGFSMIVKIRPKYLFFASLGGLLTYAVWFICDYYGQGIFISNFVGAIAGAIYAEILARIFKTPTIEFSLSSVIPLAPGSFLYYAISSFINNDYPNAFDNMVKTLMIGFGIAAGMICVSIIPILFNKNKLKHRENIAEKANK